jgi:hypothetical protein
MKMIPLSKLRSSTLVALYEDLVPSDYPFKKTFEAVEFYDAFQRAELVREVEWAIACQGCWK